MLGLRVTFIAGWEAGRFARFAALPDYLFPPTARKKKSQPASTGGMCPPLRPSAILASGCSAPGTTTIPPPSALQEDGWTDTYPSDGALWAGYLSYFPLSLGSDKRKLDGYGRGQAG